MKPIDRVRSVIHFQETDRPPVIPELIAVTATMEGISPKEYVQSGKVIAECQLSAQRRIGHDAVFAMADLCIEAEAVGCKLHFPEDNYPYVKDIVIRNFSDLKKVSLPNPASDGRMPELLKAVRLLKENVDGRLPVIAQVAGPITLASRIMDIEKMLYMIVDNPHQFREILAFCLKVSARFASALAEEGVDGIIVFDPTASPSVLPERIFKEFELAPLRKLFDKMKKINPEIITWYSVAGPVQTNPSILNSVHADISTIDYMVPIETAMNYSGTTAINGNIKPNLFVEGNEDDILKEAAALLAATRSTERFILGSGCEIPLYSKMENIAMLVKAVEMEKEYFETVNAASKEFAEVTILPHKKIIKVAPDSTLLDAVQHAGIPITSYCYKSGACGKCVVRIKKGEVASPGKAEKLQLQFHESRLDDRLACHVSVKGPIEIYIPYKSRILKRPIDVPEELYKKSIEVELKQKGFSPSIEVKNLDLSDIENSSPRSYEKWISNKFKSYEVSSQVIGRLLPLVLNKAHKAKATIDLNRREIIDFSHSDKAYGLALDIGTTTISAYLHNLQTGKLESIGLIENAQSQWGLDVISRATNTIRDPSLLPIMQEKLIEGINSIISQIIQDYSIPHYNIYDITIVANPIITHFFLGLSPESLSQSPFIPAVSNWVSTSADSLGGRLALSVNHKCRIEILPSIGGFVGSDIVAGILATGLHNKKEISLFMDIGTNGEIVLGNRDRLVCTSIAAGPAFEGGHLANGHACQKGIIHKINIDDSGGVHYETLGGIAPFGLCGSSFIDSLADFVRHDIIDSRGHFTNSNRWPQIKNNFFILVPKQNTSTFNPIGISSKDVEEIQKAKSALRTGIDLLIREARVSIEEIKNVFISGSFGFSLDIENAKTIGMIPEFPSAEFHIIKNSAGIGARLALLSRNARKEAEDIASSTEHINLAQHGEFNDRFIDNMLFPATA